MARKQKRRLQKRKNKGLSSWGIWTPRLTALKSVKAKENKQINKQKAKRKRKIVQASEEENIEELSEQLPIIFVEPLFERLHKKPKTKF